MVLFGRVRNGVVVLEGNAQLPDGTRVRVSLDSAPLIERAKNAKRVELPLVPSSRPGSVVLTNQKIAEIMDEEDAAGIIFRGRKCHDTQNDSK